MNEVIAIEHSACDNPPNQPQWSLLLLVRNLPCTFERLCLTFNLLISAPSLPTTGPRMGSSLCQTPRPNLGLDALWWTPSHLCCFVLSAEFASPFIRPSPSNPHRCAGSANTPPPPTPTAPSPRAWGAHPWADTCVLLTGSQRTFSCLFQGPSEKEHWPCNCQLLLSLYRHPCFPRCSPALEDSPT